MQVAGGKDAECWKSFFATLEGDRRSSSPDLDAAIARAVRETWPEAILYHSRHHLAAQMDRRALADGVPERIRLEAPIPLARPLPWTGERVVRDGPPAPAAVRLADEARQRRFVAVLPRPPPAQLSREALAGRHGGAIAARREQLADDPRAAGLAGLAPGAQGDEGQHEVEPAGVLPAARRRTKSGGQGRAPIRRREDRDRADGLELHVLKRCPEDLAEPVLGVTEVVEAALPVESAEEPSCRERVLSGLPDDRGTEQDPRRCKDVGNVRDGDSLARERPRQAVDDEVKRRGVERPVDRQRLRTSASTAVTSRDRNRRETCPSTLLLGSRIVTLLPSGRRARARK